MGGVFPLLFPFFFLKMARKTAPAKIPRKKGKNPQKQEIPRRGQNSRTKNQPKEEVLGTDIPQTSGGHSRGCPGPKLRSGRSKSWKNKHFSADIHDPKARTSTTLRGFQKLRSEKLWAEFSFPKQIKAVLIRESFCESGEVSGFREKGLTSGEVRELPGKFGELPGKSGKLPGTSGLLLSSRVRELPGKSPKNFRGTSGEVRGLPRSSGEPDSLPATRQICLQA